MRLLSSGSYQAGSWEHPRKVAYKGGTREGHQHPLCGDQPPRSAGGALDWYVRRGETEGWIKDFKRALMKADRLSCHRFWANQFRLLLHAAAYWLLDALRAKLVEAGVRRMQLDTLRLMLVKIGGRVRQLLAKVR